MSMEDILSPEIMQWIEDNNWQNGMKETLSASADAEDQRRRQLAIRLAVEWYQAYTNGVDGPNMPVQIEKTLKKYVAKENQEETLDDQVDLVWANMCINAAEYNYAKLQPDHEFTRGLMAVYLALSPDDFVIESIYTPIRKAIKKGLKNNPSSDKGYYGIRKNGLQSSIVFPTSDGIIPPNVDVWLEV